jgi:hypothetical protein
MYQDKSLQLMEDAVFLHTPKVSCFAAPIYSNSDDFCIWLRQQPLIAKTSKRIPTTYG